MFSLIGLLTKLFTDIAYTWVDPRVKFSGNGIADPRVTALTPHAALPGYRFRRTSTRLLEPVDLPARCSC